MADIIDFDQFQSIPDLSTLSWEGLHNCLDAIRHQLSELDKKEPRNMNSEAYEAWADRHEELEDLVDDIMDCLDEIGGPDA